MTVRVSCFGVTPEAELPDPGEARAVSGTVALDETTVLVPEHWRGEIDGAGTVRMWTR